MAHLVAYVVNNRPGKKDASGAFIPEAHRYMEIHGTPLHLVHEFNTARRRPAARRWDFEDYCNRVYRYGERHEALSIFCHGTHNQIQLGYSRDNVAHAASALRHVVTRNPVVTIYACSTAENDVKDREIDEVGTATAGGFADVLRSELMAEGIDATVIGHKTAGHATRNPYAVAFDEDCASVGGRWIVEPQSELWPAWVDALQHTDLRFTFQFLGSHALKEWLKSYKLRDSASDHRQV